MSFVFFTSYARADRNSSFDRFINLLKEDVASKTGDSPAAVAFHDVKTIRAGSQWRNVLSEGLRRSRVMVFFYSPRYIRSVYCGKEYRAFLERLEAWESDPANKDRELRALFPVLWELHAPVPSVVSRFQDSDDDFPAKYRKLGLRELGALKKHRDSFREVSLRLAGRIHEALKLATLPHADPLPPLEEIQPVWEWQPFNVSLICWHPEGSEWRPYPDDEAVLEIAEQVTSNRRLACREFSAGPTLIERLEQCRGEGDAVVVVTSPDALQSPHYTAMWQEFDTRAPVGCGLLVAWDGQGVDREQASAIVRAALPKRTSCDASRHDELVTVTSAKVLREKTEILIERMLSIARAGWQPSRKAESSALEKTAQSEGIAPQTLPGLAGPGSSK